MFVIPNNKNFYEKYMLSFFYSYYGGIILIRLATCFSGIGAIEHALGRMGIDYKIIFACDNGDVKLFSKSISEDVTEMKNLISELSIITNNIIDNNYREDFKNNLHHISLLFDDLLKCVDDIFNDEILIIKKILITISLMKNVKSNFRNKNNKMLKKLLRSENNTIKQKIYALNFSSVILNVFHNDNDWEILEKDNATFFSKNNIDWKLIQTDLINLKNYLEKIEGYKIKKNIRDISERLSMMYEKLFTISTKEKLLPLSFNEKKQYVDNLYRLLESKNKVKKSYMANYNIEERHFHWNINFLDANEYKNKVDLFVGGSPCQSFSSAGKQRGLEDTRGTLFYEFARLIKEIQPKVFIYENVRGILYHNKGETWKTILQVFTELNYKWSYQILNSKNFGIPQSRNRVFVIGFRNDLKLCKEFEFPSSIELKYRMKDFLEEDVENKYYLSEKVKKFVLSTGTKNFHPKPEIDLDIARTLMKTMHHMHRASIDNYVTQNGRLRRLTPRECLRLMGFDDDFKIVVADMSMYQQAGNSIVVNVLMYLMRSILDTYPELNH